jgi:hypothetical protein
MISSIQAENIILCDAYINAEAERKALLSAHRLALIMLDGNDTFERMMRYYKLDINAAYEKLDELLKHAAEPIQPRQVTPIKFRAVYRLVLDISGDNIDECYEKIKGVRQRLSIADDNMSIAGVHAQEILQAPEPPLQGPVERDWPEWREDVRVRDGHKCQKCGSKNDLEVHHIYPACLGGANSFGNLITLCFSCHNKVHTAMGTYGGYR